MNTPPSRLKAREALQQKHFRRCFWMLYEVRKNRGINTVQSELCIFLDSLSIQEFYDLLNALRADRKTH